MRAAAGGLVLGIGGRNDIIDIILIGLTATLTGTPTTANTATMKDNMTGVEKQAVRNKTTSYVAGKAS